MDYKDVTIKGRKFRVKKFDARTGSFMLVKVIAIAAPVITAGLKLKTLSDVKDIKSPEIDFSKLFSGLTDISEKDFNYIQEQSLKKCFEVLPAGETPVINDNGSWGIQNIEFDATLAMALTVHTLMFNVEGFFEGNLLDSLLGGK